MRRSLPMGVPAPTRTRVSLSSCESMVRLLKLKTAVRTQFGLPSGWTCAHDQEGRGIVRANLNETVVGARHLPGVRPAADLKDCFLKMAHAVQAPLAEAAA